MNKHRQISTAGRFALALAVPALSFSLKGQESGATDGEEEVFELSPFVVTGEEEPGYRASSTLAGTRIKTDVKDVGASVSIYTSEFLQDIDGKSLEDVLTFTTNTEVAGAEGNFSGAFSGEDNTGARVEAARSNRVRGLASATLTRNYFATDIPWDSYNSQQITIIRGPNAVLAGAGDPGGLIEGSLLSPQFDDTYSVSFQIGRHGAHREVLNLNQELIEDRFAARLDVLNEERKYKQDPANEKDRRVHFAMNAILRDGASDSFFGRTSVRGNYENGEIKGTPPNPLPPMSSLEGWFSESDAGKWYLEGHNRQRVAGDNATGSLSPGQEFSFGQFPEGFVEGFPMFAQVGLIFADPSSDTATVGLSGDLASIQGFQGVANPGGGFLRATGDSTRNRAGFSRARLLDRNVFDYYNHLLTGAFDYREQEFDSFNIALEQLILGGKGGFEFAYDKQDYRLEHDIPIRGDGTEIFIDVNRTLAVRDSNEEPILNPNFSRPFVISRDAFRDELSERERETYRFTGFIGHDFRSDLDSWWGDVIGRHTLSGLYQDTRNDFVNEAFKSTWPSMAGDYNMSPSVGDPGAFRAQVISWFYIGEPTIDLDGVEDIRLSPIRTARPEFGQNYDVQVYTGPSRTHRTVTAEPLRVTANYSQNQEVFESAALAHQAYLLDEHLVTLFSYREDTSARSLGQFPGDRDPSTGELLRDNLMVVDDPELKVESWTKSLVGVFPEKYLFDLPLESELRIFWNDSENFSPSGARRNIFNQDVGPPRGKTEEYGFNLSTLGGKLDLRATWYETKVVDSSVFAGGNPYGYLQTMMIRLVDSHNSGVDIDDPAWGWNTFGFNSFIDAANAFRDGLPGELNIGTEFQFNPTISDNGDGTFTFNPDGIPQLRSISDTVSEGVEIEGVFNPTRNWRISLSVAQQEAVRANVGQLELQFAEEFLQNMEDAYGPEIFAASRNPAIGEEGGWLFQYNNEHIYDIRAEAAKSGTLLPELAEWRVNVVTNYRFSEGALKGFSVGGAMRWTDERAVGYPNTTDEFGNTVADIANPFYASDDARLNLNARYSRDVTLFGKDVDWTLALYTSNVLGDSDALITKINPDGSVGQVRMPPERSWNLTTSFRW